MEHLERLISKAELLFSVVLSRYFGVYKNKIDFLKEYRAAGKTASGNKLRNAFIFAYAIAILACAAAYIIVSLQISEFKSETAFIEPNINRAEEKRLTAELADARAELERYKEIEKMYNDYETSYDSEHFLSVAEIEALYEAAESSGVTIRGIDYAQDTNTAELDCLVGSPELTYLYADKIKQSMPGVYAESLGYTLERDSYRFRVRCVFPPKIPENPETELEKELEKQ